MRLQISTPGAELELVRRADIDDAVTKVALGAAQLGGSQYVIWRFAHHDFLDNLQGLGNCKIDTFHPDRMASRILGMGDMLSLIEKAQSNVDEEKAKELEEKFRTSTFTFDDFLEQMSQVKQMGPLDEILKMLPGANKIKGLENAKVDESQMDRVEAIIYSMTKKEKTTPEIINANRKKRIAKGSGTSIQDVNRLLKQFEDMKKMMKQMSGMNTKKGKKKMGMSGLDSLFK